MKARRFSSNTLLAHYRFFALTSGYPVTYYLSGTSTGTVMYLPSESPEASSPVDLNSFFLMSLRTLLQSCALVRSLDPLESITYTLFCST